MKPLLMFTLAALASTPVAARSPQVSAAAPDISRKPAPDGPAGRSGGTSPDRLSDLSQLAPDADPQVLALGLSAMQCAQPTAPGLMRSGWR